MKTRNGIIIAIALLLTALIFYSCEAPAALGTKLNLEPPTVTIIEPDFMQNIDGVQNLIIRGSAKDLEEVVFLNISIEETKGDTWKKELLSTRGNWTIKNSVDAPWIEINSGTWEIIQKGSVEWSIEVPLDAPPAGEFLITVGAENNVKNTGPVAQRRVIIDTEPPVVTIILPVLKDIKSELDSYNLRKPADWEMLHTQSVKIQYEIKDDFSIAKLELKLTDDSEVDVYNKTFINPGQSGSITIKADEITGGTTGKKYLFITSKATDKAGNEDSDNHGWLAWWPQADTPWSEGLGGAHDANQNLMTQVYSQSQVYGQAFAKQGVKSITYKVFSYNTSTSTYNTSPTTTNTLTNTPLEGAALSTFFSFKFNAPEAVNRYKVDVETEDINGKKGVDSFWFFVFKPEASPLLVTIGGSPPGLYGLGKTIEIFLNLREPVIMAGANTLTLNVNKSGGGTAIAALDTSTNGTLQLRFTYTVAAGDSVALLKVNSINKSSLSKPGNVGISDDLIITNNLDYYTRIEISTNVPVLNSAALASSTLTLTFSKPIYKGTGNITLTQQGTPLAPAVLTKAEYERFGGAALSSYYTAGINGTDSTGKPDTTEKYILNYATNTNNAALRTLLTNNGAFSVTIPVASGAVKVSGSSLEIDLSNTYGYAPRVKGASYAITYPEGLVRDNQNNQVAALNGTSRTFATTGVNPPFIRVEKKRETFSTSGSILNPTITQVPSPDSYWIKDAAFLIQAAKPTAAGTWVEIPAFVIGTLNGQSRNITGIMQANSPGALYIQGTKNEGAAVQNGRGRVHGTLNQNNTTSTSFRTEWGTPGGFNNVDNNVDNFWVNPYENTMTPWDGNWSNTGFLVGVENQPSMWINTNTGTKYTTQTANCIYVGSMVDQLNYTTTAMAKNVTAVQPLTVGVKIDCQTPGATVSYSYNTGIGNPYSGKFGLPGETGHPTKIVVTMPGASATNASTFNLGEANNLNGYIYAIRAQAANGGSTEVAYERAIRSVILFNNIANAGNWSTLRDAAGADRQLQLWIRGGDDKSGSSLTPNFPLSWSDADYKGARLMAGITDAGTWYWVTWEVSTQAYFHFVAGTTMETDTVNAGPHSWGWAKNAWSFQHGEFPLYPGGCLVFSRNTQVTHPATDNFEFYNAFSGSR